MHLKASVGRDEWDGLVLINIIQAGVGSSGSASKSALPIPAESPGTGTFVSALQKLQTPTSVTSEPQSGAVAGREKPAMKKTVESSTKKHNGQPDSAGVPAGPVVSDAASSLLVAASLATTPAVPQALAASIATSSSTALAMMSKLEVAAIPAAEPSLQGTAPGLAGKLQSQLSGTATTISDHISSRLGVDTGKPSLTGAPVLSPAPSAAPRSTTLPVAFGAPDIATIDVERAGTSVPDQDTVAKGTAAASFGSQTSPATPGSNVMVANTTTQEFSASVRNLAKQFPARSPP